MFDCLALVVGVFLYRLGRKFLVAAFRRALDVAFDVLYEVLQDDNVGLSVVGIDCGLHLCALSQPSGDVGTISNKDHATVELIRMSAGAGERAGCLSLATQSFALI